MTQQEIDRHTQTLHADRLQRGLTLANRAASVTAEEIHAAGEHRRATYEPAPDENSEFESLCRCHETRAEDPSHAVYRRERRLQRRLLILAAVIVFGALWLFIRTKAAQNEAIFQRVTAEQIREGVEVRR